MTRSENPGTNRQVLESILPSRYLPVPDGLGPRLNRLTGLQQSPGPEQCGRSDWNPLTHKLSKV